MNSTERIYLHVVVVILPTHDNSWIQNGFFFWYIWDIVWQHWNAKRQELHTYCAFKLMLQLAKTSKITTISIKCDGKKCQLNSKLFSFFFCWIGLFYWFRIPFRWMVNVSTLIQSITFAMYAIEIKSELNCVRNWICERVSNYDHKWNILWG